MMLDEFRRDLVGKNRAKNTLKIIDLTLGTAQEQLKKPLETLSIDDLKKYFEGLKEKGRNVNTIELHQQKFVQFYKWCLDETDDDKYATIYRKLKRIKVERVRKIVSPNEILFPDEIKKLINVATIERDRCIIAVLYESGMRIGELLALTTDMVELDEMKQEVRFNIPSQPGCKTGARTVVCLEIYGYVQDWLKCNPSKQFIYMSESGLRHIIERLFEKACIKKPCNIHHFRHSAITHAAGLNMSETQLSYRFWGIPHSAMLSVYIHLNEQLKSSGYRDAKGMGESNGKTVVNPLASRCVECGRLIQAGSLCKTCTDSKKLSEENKELKARMQTSQTQMDAFEAKIAKMQTMMAAYQDITKVIATGKIKVITTEHGEQALEIVQNDIENKVQKEEGDDKKQILKQLQKREDEQPMPDMSDIIDETQKNMGKIVLFPLKE